MRRSPVFGKREPAGDHSAEQRKPFCPFCKEAIKRPVKNPVHPMKPFPEGRCSCGAVYISDLTGKNGGEALILALTSACGGDEARVWTLEEERDYLFKVMSYDSRKHLFNKRGHFKDGMARLYFVRLMA